MKKLKSQDYLFYKAANFTTVLFLALLLMFIWQLYRGAVQLPFLKPYIIRALNHDDADYQVDLESVSLELVRSLRPLRIIAKNVTYKKEDAITINAPKVSLSFSVKALVHGIISPSLIEVDNPSIYVYSRYQVDKGADDEEVKRKKLEYYMNMAENFWDHFNSEDNTYPESYINSIIINKAELELLEVDLGKKWHFSDVNYVFDRGFGSLNTEINALMPFEDTSSSMGLSAQYNYADNQVELDFYFADLIPTDLLKLLVSESDIADIYDIKTPLHGQIGAIIKLADIDKYKDDLLGNSDKIIEKINFDFAGEKGVIKFGKDDKYDYNIAGVLFKGSIAGNLDKITIEDAKVNLDGQEALLGLKIEGLNKYLKTSSLKNLKLVVNAKVDKLETSKLTDYWPRYFGDSAWEWCQESLYDGYIKNGDFNFNFAYDNKSKTFGFRGLDGIADIDGSTIFYLKGMPVVSDAKGKARFSTSRIYIDITQGKSDGVMLNGGFVDLYDLDKEDNFLKLNLLALGSISDILKLIDHEPLNYPSSAGLSPDAIKGSGEVDLKLDLELREDISPSDVTIDVKAVLHDVEIGDIIAGRALEAKTLDLTLDNQKMEISGVANIDGQPISLNWFESFGEQKSYRRRYTLGFNFDQNLMNKLGFDLGALKAPFIRGTIPSKAVITMGKDDVMNIDAHGQLRGTIIDYGFLGFAKAAGENGEISAQLQIKDNRLFKISSFELAKEDFKLNGQAFVDDKGRINKVDITSIKGPYTNASAKIDISYANKQKVKVTVSGASYDLSPFFDNPVKEKTLDKSAEKSGAKSRNDDTWDNIPDTDINIAVDKLWTAANIYTSSFAGRAQILNKTGVEEMHLVGSFKPAVGADKKASRPHFKLDYIPRGNKEYLLSIDSNDAGSALKFLRIYDYLKGGSLSIEAKRGADKVMVGHAKARNFNLTKTGILVKLLTLASFTGIVDMLSGDGIAFTHFDAPFEYKDEVLKLKGSKVFGNVLGISLSGEYDSYTDNLNFKGMVAPAYGLNAMLGKIPLVGNLLSGRDGTVFAANYDITGDISDPVININPLSALSPNSIKELWNDNFEEVD